MITQELAHQLFEYRDGALYWKIRASRGVYAGDKVGFVHPTGYRRFMYKRKGYAAHRIIWLMHHGNLPDQIDHKDLNKLNNNIENLRAVNNAQNQQNVKLRKDNTTSAKNVFWNKMVKKWAVIVVADKKRRNIGYFKDLELADLVATMAREKYHGAFANHG
jgi:hypothetical protein